MNDNVIFNFTDVYRNETFYLHEQFRWIDCTDIQGADGFCDNDATQEILHRMSTLRPEGIHFIDSGNYHYLSKFFTDKITEDFILVVFDHHPDMQSSIFDGLLTCGDWVKESLDTNHHLKKVMLLGTSDMLLNKIDSKYSQRMITYKESQINDHSAWESFYRLHFNLPIYISVDKDVMSKDEEDTNWDQGNASFLDLKKAFSFLLHHDRVIGVDICGECPNSIQGIIDQNLQKDNEINRQLSVLFKKSLNRTNTTPN